MKILAVQVPSDVQGWLATARYGPIVEELDLGDALDSLKHEDTTTPFDVLLVWLNSVSTDQTTQFIRLVRRTHETLPLIGVATYPREPIARAHFLDTGGDDLLFAPIHKDELLASMRAAVRRAHGQGTSIIRFAGDDGFVDLHTRRLVVKGHPLHLTSHEYSIIEVLARSLGRALGREKILQHVYRRIDFPVDTQIADVYVGKIRKKLRNHAPGFERHLQTKRGYGFALVASHDLPP